MAAEMTAAEMTSRIVQLEADTALLREDCQATKSELIGIIRHMGEQKQALTDAVQVEFAKANSRIDILINDSGAKFQEMSAPQTASLQESCQRTQTTVAELEARVSEVERRGGKGGSGGGGSSGGGLGGFLMLFWCKLTRRGHPYSTQAMPADEAYRDSSQAIGGESLDRGGSTVISLTPLWKPPDDHAGTDGSHHVHEPDVMVSHEVTAPGIHVDAVFRYLPEIISGKRVLLPAEEANTFLLDNSELKHTGRGVAYRKSSAVDDRDRDMPQALWQTTVRGVLEHGWLKVCISEARDEPVLGELGHHHDPDHHALGEHGHHQNHHAHSEHHHADTVDDPALDPHWTRLASNALHEMAENPSPDTHMQALKGWLSGTGASSLVVNELSHVDVAESVRTRKRHSNQEGLGVAQM